jgi:hypothetical protein
MQSSDLHRELQELADELGPFESDLHGLRARERRRTIIRRVSALAVVIVLVAGAVALVASRNGNKHRVIVENPAKVQPLAQLRRAEYLIGPATPGVQNALESSSAVAHYSRVTGLSGRGVPLSALRSLSSSCVLEAPAYAVETTVPAAASPPAGLPDGTRVVNLAGAGLPDDPPSAAFTDAPPQTANGPEIFMKADAAPSEVAAVRAALNTDPVVASIRFLDHNDALAEFKRIFADQPALVQSTKAADLPESFRITTQTTKHTDSLQRYTSMPGVDTIITPNASCRTP